MHYANMPMQYFAILNVVKIDNFQMKIMVVFFFHLSIFFFSS